MSEGQTLMPGDVLATGTPAGVGIGRNPPVYLKPGDVITVSVSGLGTLTNRVGNTSSTNPTLGRVQQETHFNATNTEKTVNGSVLSQINNKKLHYKTSGTNSGSHIVFVHGLGGTVDYWTPLISAAQLEKSHTLHLFDLEGHGLSPTSPLSTLTIESFAEDLRSVVDYGGTFGVITIIAHSIGCLVALKFAIEYPDKVSKLVLLGPPPIPFPESVRISIYQDADIVRAKGMPAVVDTIADANISDRTKSRNPLALAAIRLSLMAQDPEGYAKACTALASFTAELDISRVQAKTLIITGSDDKMSLPHFCLSYAAKLRDTAGVRILDGIGHWHVFEDFQGVVDGVLSIL